MNLPYHNILLGHATATNAACYHKRVGRAYEGWCVPQGPEGVRGWAWQDRHHVPGVCITWTVVDLPR